MREGEGELAAMNEEFLFPVSLGEGKCHWLQHDIPSINND